jgi:CopG family nickel-responsive transcriptional regulator
MKAKATSSLSRFGVSMDDSLLKKYDRLVERKGYHTRSEAISDLVRNALVEEELTDEHPDAEAVTTVSLVYNHHLPNLSAKLTEIQHHALDIITSTLHVHLDEDHCLEVLVARGPYGRVRELAEKLIAIKGVRHGKFVTATGPVKPHTHHERSRKHPHPHRRNKATPTRQA